MADLELALVFDLAPIKHLFCFLIIRLIGVVTWLLVELSSRLIKLVLTILGLLNDVHLICNLLLISLVALVYLEQLLEVRVILDVSKGAVQDDLSLFQDHDAVDEAEEVDSMGNEDARF